MFSRFMSIQRRKSVKKLLAARDESRGARAQSAFAHGPALRRALSFAVAIACLTLPMAIAAHHAEAELQIARSWPLEISATSPYGAILPDRLSDRGP